CIGSMATPPPATKNESLPPVARRMLAPKSRRRRDDSGFASVRQTSVDPRTRRDCVGRALCAEGGEMRQFGWRALVLLGPLLAIIWACDDDAASPSQENRCENAQRSCGDRCVDITTDSAHCGSCN